MPRFYDELLYGIKLEVAKQQKFPLYRDTVNEVVGIPTDKDYNLLRKCEVIDGTNVSDYFFSGCDKEYWKFEDFPNIAPPFPNVFIEFRYAPVIRSCEYGDTKWNFATQPERWGNEIISEELPDETKQGLIDNKLVVNGIPQWVCVSRLYCSYRTFVLHPVPFGVYTYVVTKDGSLGFRSDGEPHMMFSSWRAMSEEDADKLQAEVSTLVQPSWLTLSFMHCQNVRVIDTHPSPALNKKYEKRHGLPLVRYKTLVIDPMRKILEQEGGANETGLHKALHICRGHFKHYEQGGGLFGKYKGTYWWHDTVRGNLTEGLQYKDYETRPKRVS